MNHFMLVSSLLLISTPQMQVNKLVRFTLKNVSPSDLHMTLAQKIKIIVTKWRQRIHHVGRGTFSMGNL